MSHSHHLKALWVLAERQEAKENECTVMRDAFTAKQKIKALEQEWGARQTRAQEERCRNKKEEAWTALADFATSFCIFFPRYAKHHHHFLHTLWARITENRDDLKSYQNYLHFYISSLKTSYEVSLGEHVYSWEFHHLTADQFQRKLESTRNSLSHAIRKGGEILPPQQPQIV